MVAIKAELWHQQAPGRIDVLGDLRDAHDTAATQGQLEQVFNEVRELEKQTAC